MERIWADKFVFEILEVVKVKDDPDFDVKDELTLLEQIWLEKLQPFGERVIIKIPISARHNRTRKIWTMRMFTDLSLRASQALSAIIRQIRVIRVPFILFMEHGKYGPCVCSLIYL